MNDNKDHANAEQGSPKQDEKIGDKKKTISRPSMMGVISTILNFFSLLGMVTCKSIKSFFVLVRARFQKAKQKHQDQATAPPRLSQVLAGIRSLLHQLLLFLLFPFHKLYTLCGSLRRALRQTQGETFQQRVSHIGLHIKTGFRRNKRQIGSFLNHLLPVAGIATFILVVFHVNSTAFVVAISYRDVSFGYVQDEAVIERAQQIVQERMVYLEDSERLVLTPDYRVEPAPAKKELIGEFDLADKIIENSQEDIIKGEGLYIDDVFQGAIDRNGVLKQELETILEENKQGKPGEDVSFVNDVKIQEGLYLKENITDPATLSEELQNASVDEKRYAVMEGDTLTLVAEKNDVSVDLLREINASESLPKDPDEPLPQNLKLLVAEEQQALSVRVVHDEVYTEEIPYDIEIEESNEFPKTYKKVTQSGQKGEQKVTAKITTIDGKEVDRSILVTEQVKAPVTQKVVVGTLEIQPGDQIPASVGNGTIPNFIWPMSNYTVTSPFGPRWGRMHNGIDITLPGGNSMGQPYAALADGVVTFASYSGSYGNLIKIDHGDGVQTWYGHNSKLLVHPGQVVKQGDIIAEIGSTGRSTGPHIHLEVRINGTPYNPIRFLP